MLWWNICNNNLRFCSSHLLGFSSSLQLSRMSSLTFLFLLSLTYMAPCPCSWWFELLVSIHCSLEAGVETFLPMTVCVYKIKVFTLQQLICIGLKYDDRARTADIRIWFWVVWNDIMIVPSSFQSVHIAAKLTQYCSKTNSNDFSSGHKVVFRPSVLASHK